MSASFPAHQDSVESISSDDDDSPQSVEYIRTEQDDEPVPVETRDRPITRAFATTVAGQDPTTVSLPEIPPRQTGYERQTAMTARQTTAPTRASPDVAPFLRRALLSPDVPPSLRRTTREPTLVRDPIHGEVQTVETDDESDNNVEQQTGRTRPTVLPVQPRDTNIAREPARTRRAEFPIQEINTQNANLGPIPVITPDPTEPLMDTEAFRVLPILDTQTTEEGGRNPPFVDEFPDDSVLLDYENQAPPNLNPGLGGNNASPGPPMENNETIVEDPRDERSEMQTPYDAQIGNMLQRVGEAIEGVLEQATETMKNSPIHPNPPPPRTHNPSERPEQVTINDEHDHPIYTDPLLTTPPPPRAHNWGRQTPHNHPNPDTPKPDNDFYTNVSGAFDPKPTPRVPKTRLELFLQRNLEIGNTTLNILRAGGLLHYSENVFLSLVTETDALREMGVAVTDRAKITIFAKYWFNNKQYPPTITKKGTPVSGLNDTFEIIEEDNKAHISGAPPSTARRSLFSAESPLETSLTGGTPVILMRDSKLKEIRPLKHGWEQWMNWHDQTIDVLGQNRWLQLADSTEPLLSETENSVNNSLYWQLKAATKESTVSHLVEQFGPTSEAKFGNGRKAWQAIREHYNNNTQQESIANFLETKLGNIKCSDERLSLTIDAYINQFNHWLYLHDKLGRERLSVPRRLRMFNDNLTAKSYETVKFYARDQKWTLRKLMDKLLSESIEREREQTVLENSGILQATQARIEQINGTPEPGPPIYKNEKYQPPYKKRNKVPLPMRQPSNPAGIHYINVATGEYKIPPGVWAVLTPDERDEGLKLDTDSDALKALFTLAKNRPKPEGWPKPRMPAVPPTTNTSDKPKSSRPQWQNGGRANQNSMMLFTRNDTNDGKDVAEIHRTILDKIDSGHYALLDTGADLNSLEDGFHITRTFEHDPVKVSGFSPLLDEMEFPRTSGVTLIHDSKGQPILLHIDNGFSHPQAHEHEEHLRPTQSLLVPDLLRREGIYIDETPHIYAGNQCIIWQDPANNDKTYIIPLQYIEGHTILQMDKPTDYELNNLNLPVMQISASNVGGAGIERKSCNFDITRVPTDIIEDVTKFTHPQNEFYQMELRTKDEICDDADKENTPIYAKPQKSEEPLKPNVDTKIESH